MIMKFLFLGGSGALLSLLLYGFCVEPYRVEVTEVVIRDAELSRVLQGKVVLHLSDLHIRSVGNRERRVLRIIEEMSPDFVFLTGDYVKWNGEYDAALEFLSKLRAETGVWGVLGDADFANSRKSCLFCHEPGSAKPTRKHSVRFLMDSFETVETPGGRLRIAGLDFGSEEPLAFLREALDHSQEATIVLAHSPLVFDRFRKEDDVFVLAGDTHGGQIPLPSRLWALLDCEKCVRYERGLFVDGRKKMYVTRGVGTSNLPLRIGRRPEIVRYRFEGPGDATP